MAGNKVNTKNKGKEDRSKSNKVITQTNEDSEEPDFSLLRKPIQTSITGFAQARKIFDWATEELKGLLSNECDLLYECKVCRNMFRSLANFISHKRVYCKESFNASVHGHFIVPSSTDNEILRITRLEEGYHESLKEKDVDDSMACEEVDERIPLTKDLTTIIEKIAKTKKTTESNKAEQHVLLQKIPNSSVAVFQSMESNEKNYDKMKAQVIEIDDILARDKAVLQSNGTFKTVSSTPADTESVIQISDDEDDGTGSLKCKICDQQFSTQKTLKFHMKYKHLESRLVYPCPDCLEIFSTSWSVYRHLFKVHRKSAAQIRKLRESIQAKAFRMNNPPAFYEKRKNAKPAAAQKISEEERVDQENQAWMDNVEADGDTPRCFGCGRTFERRAALVSHTHTCQPRSRALARRPHETKKIEIQIRKDYNKGPPAALQPLLKTNDTNEHKIGNETTPIMQIKEETVAPISQTDEEESNLEMLDDGKSNDASKSLEETAENKILNDNKTIPKLPFAYQTEKSNLDAFKQKIQSDIELTKLLCKRCDVVHNTIQDLHDHMAGHYKWLRYACKLCNFKSYDLEKVPEHVKVVHKLKGDTDFYFSTVKAIDGVEALILSEAPDEISDVNEISPDSRRPSRCSSDSSRLSDDSSSSSTRIEGSRKRKVQHTKSASKRKKEACVNDEDDETKIDNTPSDKEMLVENDSPSISKTYEENSSDIDDIDEKIVKKQIVGNITSVASRRPVRKKTKPKNEDFEYDLSNLLKMEAQGYRDSQTVTTTKSNISKKKVGQPDNQNYIENINKDCCGALATLSKQSVYNAAAHMKTMSFLLQKVQKEPRPSNVFVRPLLPKVVSRGEKMSPKKDVDDSRDSVSREISTPLKDAKILKEKVFIENESIQAESDKNKIPGSDSVSTPNVSNNRQEKSPMPNTSIGISETTKSNKIPAVVPIKFRRQSLDVIKNNPIINKNITDFTKAGMKTKILVIKPINRGKDGATAANSTLKFQTIKIKDPSKASSSKELNSDQVVVVKVPNVESASRSLVDSNSVNSEKISSNDNEKMNNIVKESDNQIAGEICDNEDNDSHDIPRENSNSENITLPCGPNKIEISKDNSETNSGNIELALDVNKSDEILPISKTITTSV